VCELDHTPAFLWLIFLETGLTLRLLKPEGPDSEPQDTLVPLRPGRTRVIVTRAADYYSA
jgi:hypothetical protein